MLYISRIISQKRYGVVDTDTGVETVMSGAEIRNLVEVHGKEIKGVAVSDFDGQVMGDITVWQPQETISRLQVKARAIYGVVVKMNGDQVTNISIPRSMDCGRVKLSDLGKKFCASVFQGSEINGSVTFVLDDSIEVVKDTFRGWWGLDKVHMDLSAVRDNAILTAVFEDNFLNGHIMTTELPNVPVRIIESQDMRGHAIALYVLNGGYLNSSRISFIRSLMLDVSPAAKAFVDKKYRRKFINLGKRSVTISGGAFASDLELLREVAKIVHASDCVTFNDWLEMTYKYDFIESVEHIVDVNYILLMKLYNYVIFFDPDDAIKNAFVNVCKKSLDAIEASYKIS